MIGLIFLFFFPGLGYLPDSVHGGADGDCAVIAGCDVTGWDFGGWGAGDFTLAGDDGDVTGDAGDDVEPGWDDVATGGDDVGDVATGFIVPGIEEVGDLLQRIPVLFFFFFGLLRFFYMNTQ